ncbi:MAG: hypothetical protein AB7P76_09440 [Candidatus Melainabacteria bacterium]
MNDPCESQSGVRSFGDLLDAVCRIYAQHWLLLTRPLLTPVLLQLLGLYGSVAGSYALINHLFEQQPAWLPVEPAVRMAVMLGAPMAVCLLFLLVFVDGFWKFLVQMAALSRVVLAVDDGQSPDPEAARLFVAHQGWRYGWVLVASGLIQTLCLAPMGIVPLLVRDMGPLLLLEGLLLLPVTVLVLAAMMAFALVFPIAGLEVLPSSPLATLRRCLALLRGQFWVLAGMLFIVGVVTSILGPILAQVLLVVLLGSLLNAVHHWIITLLDHQAPVIAFVQSSFTQAGQAAPTAADMMDMICKVLTSLTLNTVAGALLYPLYAVSLALLYRNALARQGESLHLDNKHL